jgi:neutral ceramidase
MAVLRAGAASADITPKDSQYLYGYPHVERYSSGTHDTLLTSVLYLESDGQQAMFIANDLIHFSKTQVASIREAISRVVPIDPQRILVSASHTHSGPIMVYHLNAISDPTVPQPDPSYMTHACRKVAEASAKAYKNAQEAALSFGVADGSGVGTNRRDPADVADPEVPVLVVKSVTSTKPVCCMVICNMHPTILHEDSTLYSADFPGAARTWLKENVLGDECVVLYHTGPAGNQSPRHITVSNTFEEVERLGTVLGEAIQKAISNAADLADNRILVTSTSVDLIPRNFASEAIARDRLTDILGRFQRLRAAGAPNQEVRTAECDWFGAEESVALAIAQSDGRLEGARRATMPAEIQLIGVGPLNFIGWPCEVFVEYGLDIKREKPNSYVISLANGEAQGYIVTPEAEQRGGYEASNGLFAAESGSILVRETLRLLQ